jgi:uncharacterized Zn finger protein
MLRLENLTIRRIRSLAGDLWFDRGEAYFEQGRVRDLKEHQGKVTATVAGTHEYNVRLWIHRGEIASSCTCPLGDDEQFCKHCVAVALAWIASGGEQAETNRQSSSGDDLRLFLE